MYFDTNPDEFLASHALTTPPASPPSDVFLWWWKGKWQLGNEWGVHFTEKVWRSLLVIGAKASKTSVQLKILCPNSEESHSSQSFSYRIDTKKSRNNNMSLTNKNPPRTVEINSEVLRQMVQSSTSNIRQVLPGCWAFRETLKIHMV